MSSSAPALVGDPAHAAQRRIVAVLAAAQVLSGLGMGASIAVGALLAEDLSGSQALSGIPTTTTTLGAAAFAIPLARLAAARGRRLGLAAGWVIGAGGAAVVLLSAYLRVFALLPVGTLLIGAAVAAGLQSRFAATDLASPATRARDLSLVVWATTVGAVVGPNLTRPGAAVGEALHMPASAGPFVFAFAALAAAAILVGVALHPDPLAAAGALGQDKDAVVRRPARVVLRGNGAAQGGLVAIVVGHVVMVSVMTMTPVHMTHHGAQISLVGLTISLHIAGMFALSPVLGWLTDHVGPRPVILGGLATLAAATVTAGTAGASVPRLTAGLVLLGLGWSAELVAGSSLLSDSVAAADRPSVQGFADLSMNLAGAAGGALAGVVVALGSFGVLNALAGSLLVVPLLLALRRREPVTP